MSASLKLFFKNNPVFRTKQLIDFYDNRITQQSCSNLIQYHKKKEHIVKIKHELYACVPEGVNPNPQK